MDVVVNGTKDTVPVRSKPLIGHGNYYSNFLVCLGCDSLSLPLADLLRRYHQLEGLWLIASPIHWEATHNDAMIVALDSELELTEKESRLWFAEIKEFLKADSFDPVYHNSDLWLLKIDDKPAIRSKSVYSMLHQSMMPVLHTLDSTFYWQRLITELQMFLSAHQLNSKRENKFPINGLWFWGEGKFNIPGNRPIVTDDEELLSLASSTSSPISRLTPATVFEKDHLLIINNPQQIELCNLEEKIKKNAVHWYWNNVAYSCEPNHWWSSLWR